MIGYSKEIERYFLDCDGCGLRLESEAMVSLFAKTFEDLIRAVLDKGCRMCWRKYKNWEITEGEYYECLADIMKRRGDEDF